MYWRNKFWWIPFGNVPEISPNELYQKLVGDSAPHLLDVRTHRDWIASRIEGAVNVPITSFRAEAAEFPLHGCRHPLPVPVPFARQREVGLQVLLDEAVEDGLLGAATGVGSWAASLWIGGHIGSAARSR